MFSYGAIRGQDKSSIVRTIKKKRAIQVVVWLIIGILRSFDSLHVVVYSCRQHVLIFNAFSEMKRNFESLKLAPSLFFFFCKEEESYLYVNFFLFLSIQNVISQKSTFSPCVLTVRHLVHSPLVTSEHSGTSQTSDICHKKKTKNLPRLTLLCSGAEVDNV